MGLSGTINLRQLSTYLDLSQTTVSRALNGYPEVSESTRKRVSEAANRLGYQPSAAARHLATGKSGAIGYVLPVGQNVDLDPHFVEFLSGLGEHAVSHNVDLVLSPASWAEEETAYRRIAKGGMVDAVYLSSMRNADSRIGLLQKLQLPFLAHGRAKNPAGGYSFLDIDNEGAFRSAANLLLQLGHRRIGFINGEDHLTFAGDRLRGVKSAIAAIGLPEQSLQAHFTAMSEENGYRFTIQQFEREPALRPTAILCASMFSALGVIRALNHLGLKVPDDVSVVAHDDVFTFLRPERFSVPLTTTRSSIRAAGQRVCERLLEIMSDREPGVVEEVWPVDLIVRGSTGAAPRSAG
jgi:LacI family transcriptional regulator